MKFYLLIDDRMTGKTRLLDQLGYTFCSDDGGVFSPLHKLIAAGEKKIAIDDYRNEGSAAATLKYMYDGDDLVCEQTYKDPVYITADDYKDVEIVLVVLPKDLPRLGLGLPARCQKVSVEEFKKIKGIK